MVVKTELCAFSEYRIYPGHGIKFIRRDGQPVLLSTSKCKSMVNQKKKSANLMWTQAWRRLNKKGKDEGIAKKKARKVIKIQRAIVGATLDELTKKRLVSKPKPATPAAVKEVKERTKAARVVNKAAAIPKIQPSRVNQRGGTTR